MNRITEARQIIEAVKAGNFSLRVHARLRSAERALPVEEIQSIAATAVEWLWQDDRQTHKFLGYRRNGRGGGFTAVLDGGAVIVTVFKRSLNRWER